MTMLLRKACQLTLPVMAAMVLARVRVCQGIAFRERLGTGSVSVWPAQREGLVGQPTLYKVESNGQNGVRRGEWKQQWEVSGAAYSHGNYDGWCSEGRRRSKGQECVYKGGDSGHRECRCRYRVAG